MLPAVLRRASGRALFHTTAAAAAKPAAAPKNVKSKELVLNFALPHRTIFPNTEVKRVTVPAREGALGIERDMPPTLAELSPGTVRVDLMDGSASETFVAGGWTMKDANNKVIVSSTEGVALDSVDPERLRAAVAEARSKLAAAGGSGKPTREAEAARVELSTLSALAKAMKLTV